MNSPLYRDGRPRDEDVTRRILDLTWDAVRDHGPAGVDIERIAQAAGCAKTTIYRRWRNRDELVVAAVMDGMSVGEDPNTGDVVSDLVEFELVNVANHRRRYSAVIFSVDLEHSETFWREIFEPREAIFTAIISRAKASGQLPPRADAAAILDMLSGFVHFRSVGWSHLSGSTEIAEVPRAALTEVVRSVVTSPPLTLH
jgi:AcrR family transcriptional regulator